MTLNQKRLVIATLAILFLLSLAGAGGAIAFEPTAEVEHSHRIRMIGEFKRIYCDHRNLYELFGLRNVPSWRAVWDGWAWQRNFYRELLAGLTLTGADTVIHYDPWWNPAAQAQATDRAYRIGQKRPVFVYNLIVAGSVEERMLQLQERKRRLADAILAGELPSDTRLTEDDVEVLFAPLPK